MPTDLTSSSAAQQPASGTSLASDYKLAGAALIGGSVAGFAVMALHPTGNDLFRPGMFSFMARLATAVHALALLATPVMFLGCIGLMRRFDARNRLALAALVFYGFGCMAVMNAATLSGLIAPEAGKQVARTDHPELHDAWRVAFHYNGDQNQGYARVYVVAVSAALLLWSIAILKQRESAWKRIAIYGCILAPITIALVASGYLPLNVHGFGMVMITQGLWFIFAGLQLRSDAKLNA